MQNREKNQGAVHGNNIIVCDRLTAIQLSRPTSYQMIFPIFLDFKHTFDLPVGMMAAILL